jgi:hypothetical protein
MGTRRRERVLHTRGRSQSAASVNLTNSFHRRNSRRAVYEKKLSRADKIELNTSLVTHARANCYEWRGAFTLR